MLLAAPVATNHLTSWHTKSWCRLNSLAGGASGAWQLGRYEIAARRYSPTCSIRTGCAVSACTGRWGRVLQSMQQVLPEPCCASGGASLDRNRPAKSLRPHLCQRSTSTCELVKLITGQPPITSTDYVVLFRSRRGPGGHRVSPRRSGLPGACTEGGAGQDGRLRECSSRLSSDARPATRRTWGSKSASLRPT